MRVVFDTNVIVPALVFEDSLAEKIFRKTLEENHKIFASDEILEEVEKVLKRDFKKLDDITPYLMSKLYNLVEIVIPDRK